MQHKLVCIFTKRKNKMSWIRNCTTYSSAKVFLFKRGKRRNKIQMKWLAQHIWNFFFFIFISVHYIKSAHAIKTVKSFNNIPVSNESCASNFSMEKRFSPPNQTSRWENVKRRKSNKTGTIQAHRTWVSSGKAFAGGAWKTFTDILCLCWFHFADFSHSLIVNTIDSIVFTIQRLKKGW